MGRTKFENSHGGNGARIAWSQSCCTSIKTSVRTAAGDADASSLCHLGNTSCPVTASLKSYISLAMALEFECGSGFGPWSERH